MIVDDGEYWVGLNTGRAPKVKVLADSTFDIAPHYEEYTVQECSFRRSPMRNGAGLETCVTFVKKILCIRAWWVQTPYQLHRYLRKRK